MVINTNMTEKVIKLLTYSIIYFATYLRTTATIKLKPFYLCVCLNETSLRLPEVKLLPTAFLQAIGLP